MNLEEIALLARKLTIKITAEGNAPHIGSCLSVMDILVSIYFDIFDKELTLQRFENRTCPRILLSKGHAAAALYTVLHLKGFLSLEQLLTFHKNSGLPGHVDTSVNGIEFSTGSLGHGLGVGVGMALANKINGSNIPVIVIMGDGECQEGEVWEAANFALANRIDNIIVIIDNNELQAYGVTTKIGGNLKEKWVGFGWNVIEADGHDFASLKASFLNAFENKKPTVIIAHTIKCKGIAHFEGKIESHYKPPKGNELG